ncbi:MAG: radical SAM/SPASM domain-containing protein [Clostridiales bacterium]|nr:radical SAM/SPASM domain-containing protein [Clostridiales bacterium]
MKKRFKKVYVEITNICNLSCNFCPKTKREHKFISIEEFRHVLYEIRPFTDYIYLHLMGEPLLHPELEQLLCAAKEYGLKVNMTTNGTLLPKKENILLQSQALRQINISLHSFEANEVDMTLLEYVQNVLDFVTKAQKTCQVISSIRLWNMDSEKLQGANDLNHKIMELVEHYFPQERPLSEILTESRQLKLADRVYINMAEKFKWPDLNHDETNHEVFCYGMRDQIGILVDGTVVPCCLDSEGTINLGNIYKQSFEEIVQSERAEKMYHGFSKRKAVEDLCKKCHFATARFSS